MNISEKVAYIKGLAEGLSVDDKVVNAILDVLGDIAKELGMDEDVFRSKFTLFSELSKIEKKLLELMNK